MRAKGYPHREAAKPLFPLSVSPAAHHGEYDALIHAAVGDKVEHGADGTHHTCSISSVSVLQSGELWAEAEVIIKIKLSPELQRHESLLGENLAKEVSRGAKEALAGSALATSLIQDELVAREEKSKEEHQQMEQKGLWRAPPEQARKPTPRGLAPRRKRRLQRRGTASKDLRRTGAMRPTRPGERLKQWLPEPLLRRRCLQLPHQRRHSRSLPKRLLHSSFNCHHHLKLPSLLSLGHCLTWLAWQLLRSGGRW